MPPVIYTTGRLTVEYTTTRLTHEFSVFARTGADQADLVLATRNFLSAVAPLVYASTTFGSARWQEAGSNFSLPVAWAPITGSAAGTLPRELEAIFMSFRARSTSGKQSYVDLFAPALPLTDNYRYTPGEDANVDAAVLAWNTLGGAAGSNDGASRTIYPYVNMGVHAYWQRQLRNP